MSIWERRATLPLYGPTEISDVVHDGDTVKFLIDEGYDMRAEKWLRFSGVRAPETNEAGITETRLFVSTWLGTRYGLHRSPIARRRWPFRILSEIDSKAEPDQHTSFARYLGWIYDIETGECLNEAMNRYLGEHPEWPAGREVTLA
jgi:hypothetical protein